VAETETVVGRQSAAVALTLAGSDSSAGAGAQADLKTFAAHGVYGLSAITCVVAEVPGKVSRIHGVPADVVREQIEVLFAGFPIAAVKTGLLYSKDNVEVVASTLARCFAATGRNVPLVIDPVMVATTGDLLLLREAIETYEQHLFPLASLVTPNLDEVATLLRRRVDSVDGMRAAGRELQQKYRVPFLIKGGHLAGADAVDLLFEQDTAREFSAPFVAGVSTHGTGCTYSAAITAGLARGLPLASAIGEAKSYVTRTIADHFSWRTSAGKIIDALNHSAGPM
jgi:hydroxymethylpyrimidine/phosphomethylpyrimidine kinase